MRILMVALAGVLLASLVDLHSALAAVFAPAPPDAAGKALGAAILAISVHAFSKSATAWFAGGWRYRVMISSRPIRSA